MCCIDRVYVCMKSPACDLTDGYNITLACTNKAQIWYYFYHLLRFIKCLGDPFYRRSRMLQGRWKMCCLNVRVISGLKL